MSEQHLDPAATAAERQIAAYVREQAPLRAPAGLLDGVLASIEATRRRPAHRRWSAPAWPKRLGLALTGAVVVVAAVAIVAFGPRLLPAVGTGAAAAGGPAAIPVGDYGGTQFGAAGVVVTTERGRFALDPLTATVRSEPGEDATSRLLEVAWKQAGVPTLLTFILASDGSQWWVVAVRSAPKTEGPWTTFGGTLVSGTLFARPLGQAFVGPVDLPAVGRVQGSLHIDQLVLLPTFDALANEQPSSTPGAPSAISTPGTGSSAPPASASFPQPTAVPAGASGDIFDRARQAIHDASPAGLTFALTTSSGSGTPQLDGDVNDGRGPGRLYVVLFPSGTMDPTNPCQEADFVQGATCTRSALPNGDTMVLRGPVAAKGTVTIDVEILRTDGTGVLLEASNFSIPDMPGVVTVGPGKPLPTPRITRSAPVYDLPTLAKVAEAVADATRGCTMQTCP
jgi:hypothetical protein